MRSAPPLLLLATWLLPGLGGVPAFDLRTVTPALQDEPAVVLPEGPNARAWSGVGSATRARPLEDLLAAQPWLADAPQGPDRAAAWRGWGALLAAESARDESQPDARAALTLNALRDARWQDAWAHLERLGGFPEWSAAVLPALLPGVPSGAQAGLGGLPGALPDGVLLRPAVPPLAPPGDPRRHEPRTATVRGLRVGEATLDFTITLDGSGIEVDLLHTGGGPATVRVLLPEPEGLEIRVEYIDWMRQDVQRQPLLVELLPGEEEHNLFGRFAPRRVPLPASPTERLPRALERGGLWTEWRGAPELQAELEAAAEVLAEVLGVPGGLVAPGDPPPGEPWSATVLHVPGEEAAARRFLAQVSSRLEAWALRPR